MPPAPPGPEGRPVTSGLRPQGPRTLLRDPTTPEQNFSLASGIQTPQRLKLPQTAPALATRFRP